MQKLKIALMAGACFFPAMANAQDYSDLSNCAVVRVSGEAPGGGATSAVVVVGVGTISGSSFISMSTSTNLTIRGPQFSCLVRNTIPATNAQIADALKQSLDSMAAKVETSTNEVQQSAARMFAVQIDVLAAELEEIRSLVPALNGEDVEQIAARLDLLQQRLDALSGEAQ